MVPELEAQPLLWGGSLLSASSLSASEHHLEAGILPIVRSASPQWWAWGCGEEGG